nr:tyrosine-protein phosphatase [Kurthia zopfii]
MVKNYHATRQVVLEIKPNWLVALENIQIDPKLIDFIIDTDPYYLLYAFDEILNHYDTLENYLFEEFGITEKIRKEVQDYYLDLRGCFYGSIYNSNH